jgi:hypothetical protein
MKTNPTEKKIAGWAGSFLVLRLFFLVIAVPILLPLAGVFVQAMVWRFVLCRIDGINLMGGLLEAFALSLALGGFCACFNLFYTVIIAGAKKLKQLPVEKIGHGKVREITSWAEMYKALPGFRSLGQQFIVNTLALAFLTSLHPLRLHFDGPFQLLLSAAVLSASWIICLTIMTVAVYASMIKDFKTKAAASKAAV